MLIAVDPHSGVPVYRQLMDQIKFHIASGMLRPGDELPSTRTLSADLGVNPMTISKAYSFLEKEGVVERRPGRPLVVKAVAADQVEDRKLDRLRESLGPMVTMTRQLGIDPDEAAGLFKDMLKEVGMTEKDGMPQEEVGMTEKDGMPQEEVGMTEGDGMPQQNDKPGKTGLPQENDKPGKDES